MERYKHLDSSFTNQSVEKIGVERGEALVEHDQIGAL